MLSPQEKPVSNNSSREFTVNDVIKICCEVASKEKVMVRVPERRPSLFRRFSADINKLTVRASRSGNSLSDMDSDSSESIPGLLSRRKSDDQLRRRAEIVVDDKIVKDEEKPNKKNIPGLGDRDVVAIAILVDDEGTPMKTYTEHDDIPSEEYDAAKQVFISRVPCPENQTLSSPPPTLGNKLNIRPLADILSEDIEVDKANKLKKRMERVLIKLYTTDLETALSFLKVERYAKVHRDILRELLIFVEKDLKMIVISDEQC